MPPHRYLEDDNGTLWMESVVSGPRPRKWMIVASAMWDSISGLSLIDPGPVWAAIVAAQLRDQVSE